MGFLSFLSGLKQQTVKRVPPIYEECNEGKTEKRRLLAFVLLDGGLLFLKKNITDRRRRVNDGNTRKSPPPPWRFFPFQILSGNLFSGKLPCVCACGQDLMMALGSSKRGGRGGGPPGEKCCVKAYYGIANILWNNLFIFVAMYPARKF